ncbi:MAG: peptidoglycan DD-metalloendopeptidase family protein [Mogibacterium sp.]|nr:peptidoglycan DD-metalloendopeptidase family protein [Mogibacterium sp.]
MEQQKNKRPIGAGLLTALTDWTASWIFFHDRVQAACDRAVGRAIYGILETYHNVRTCYLGASRKIIAEFFATILMICAMLLIFDHFTVFEYSYNGRALGYVDNQENVTNILEVAGDRLSGINDANIVFTANENVTFRKVASFNKDVDTADQVLNKLTYMTDIEVTGAGIYEDGKLLTIVESDAMAEEVLRDVINYYRTPDKGMTVTSIDFLNEVEVRPVSVMLTSVKSRNNAVRTLEEGGKTSFRHLVLEGETFQNLQEIYSIDRNYVLEDGEKVYAEDILPGDSVVIESNVEPIQVQMVESGTKSETIPYETEKERTKDLYIGDQEVKQEGENGRQLITGELTLVNGKEVNRDIENTEVVKEPVNEVILVGISIRPKTAPTGTFAMPIHNYTITSYFGPRWGRVHQGLDMAAPTGMTIFASDGGEVIRAGWYSSYGNCVEIRHLNGTFTRYGHCSKIYVRVGEKVFQGQEIAAVGSTGNSTGPHLHFEIHPNGGSAVNPLPYLPIGQ